MNLMKRILFFVFGLGLALAACATPTPAPAEPTAATPLIITATLPPTATPFASPTPVQPTATPTVQPIEGQVTAPVNVRPNPSLLGEPLGLLEANSVVQVIGQNAEGTWYRVLYPAAAEGTGWVAAQYVAVANPDLIPILAQTPPPAEGNLGAVVQQLNVRSGPGVDYEVLGILPPGSNVTLLGVTADGDWYKIEYPEGGGSGWVYAPYVETNAADLPVFVPSEDGTATPLPATATPTPVPAQEDGDSPESPLVGFSLDANTRTAQFSDDLSAPLGDGRDTIQFAVVAASPDTTPVLIRIECVGGTPEISLSPLPLAEPLTCNQPFRALDVLPNRPYLLTLSLAADPDAPVQYLQYTVYLSLP